MNKTNQQLQLQITQKEEENEQLNVINQKTQSQMNKTNQQLQIQIAQINKENEILKIANQEIQAKINQKDEENEKLKMKIEEYHSKYIGHNIEYNGEIENAFKGIICHLTKGSGGNVHDKGIVKVTASSVNPFFKNLIAKNAVDLDDCTNYFQSSNRKNSWLQYDFQNKKVHPTHYSIRTRHDVGKGGYHPKSWDIEGSNDGEKWMILDSRQNITCLDDRNAIHTFDIETSHRNDNYYQFLRIQLTGPNTNNNDFLTLSALEYFGNFICSKKLSRL